MGLTPATHYIACAFGKSGARTYTYHYVGDTPPDIGEVLEVTAPHGGNANVTVVQVLDEKPSFPTKPAWR